MGLKGSAKIELTNADGTKKVVEHGNMITGAVRDLLYASRGEMSNIMRFSKNGDSYVENIFGGIMLFKDALSSDPEDYYIPSTNTVGYSSTDAYDGLDLERGSFNAYESGLQEDGTYKLIFDFTTQQANGTIKSIGLCPKVMGKIGMSDSAVSTEKVDAYTGNGALSPFDTNIYMLPSSGTTGGYSNHGFNVVAVIGRIAYAIHSDNLSGNSSFWIKNNGGILKLFKFDLGVSGIGLRNKVGMATYLGYVDVQLPTDFVSELNSSTSYHIIDYYYDDVGQKLIMYPRYGSNIAKNGTIKYIEIEITNNMNVVSRTFTNNANGSVDRNNTSSFASYYEYGSCAKLFITKDYIITEAYTDSKQTTEKIYITKKSDNTSIKAAKYANGEDYSIAKNTYNGNLMRPVYVFGNLFVFGYNTGSQYTEFKKCFVLDMSTGIIKETNAKNLTYRSNIPLDNKVTWGKTKQYCGMSIAVCPFILTTKNNLDEPVTKTASQTMKITYTLSESEGA